MRQYFENHNSLTDFNLILSPLSGWIIDGGFSFLFQGQDWLVQWFEAPADMTINKIGINFYSVQNPGAQVGVKLVNVNWTKQQIETAGVKAWGYYQADGNGYNDKTAFLDNPDRTGNWVDQEGNGQIPIFSNDIWSDGGETFNVTAETSSGFGNWQWIELNLLGNGNTVDVLKGAIVAVAVQNSEPTLSSGDIYSYAASIGQKAFKFYGGNGWWSKSYSWDFALDVSVAELPPIIDDVTELRTTLSTDERLVSASLSQIDSLNVVNLIYYLNASGLQDTIQMSSDGNNIYQGFIPGQTPGTEVFYFVEAISNGGMIIQSRTFSYKIFLPSSYNLVVFNGYTTPSGYPQSYYFGYLQNIGFEHDTWAYGALSQELLNNYLNVTEITTDGPEVINNDVIRSWLNNANYHSYALFGDEWLGAQTEWIDTTYSIGDFQYDILGIQSDHNDISYDGGVAIDGSVVHPQAETVLGGPLANRYSEVSSGSNWTAPMLYSPEYEIGENNWLDGVDFLADVEVDMTGDNFDGSTNYAILGHRTLSAGNKIVFGTYDPLSLDSDTENEVEYYWYGADYAAPQVTDIIWFGITIDVNQIGNDIPDKFVLSQNYPNPFNPTTIIKYSVPVVEKNNAVETRHALSVQLKVYDVLGREIRTLVNEKQSPGNYQVQFEAAGLPSGIYIYRIEIGAFEQSKKMILLR